MWEGILPCRVAGNVYLMRVRRWGISSPSGDGRFTMTSFEDSYKGSCLLNFRPRRAHFSSLTGYGTLFPQQHFREITIPALCGRPRHRRTPSTIAENQNKIYPLYRIPPSHQTRLPHPSITTPPPPISPPSPPPPKSSSPKSPPSTSTRTDYPTQSPRSSKSPPSLGAPSRAPSSPATALSPLSPGSSSQGEARRFPGDAGSAW